MQERQSQQIVIIGGATRGELSRPAEVIGRELTLVRRGTGLHTKVEVVAYLPAGPRGNEHGLPNSPEFVVKLKSGTTATLVYFTDRAIEIAGRRVACTTRGNAVARLEFNRDVGRLQG